MPRKKKLRPRPKARSKPKAGPRRRVRKAKVARQLNFKTMALAFVEQAGLLYWLDRGNKNHTWPGWKRLGLSTQTGCVMCHYASLLFQQGIRLAKDSRGTCSSCPLHALLSQRGLHNCLDYLESVSYKHAAGLCNGIVADLLPKSFKEQIKVVEDIGLHNRDWALRSHYPQHDTAC